MRALLVAAALTACGTVGLSTATAGSAPASAEAQLQSLAPSVGVSSLAWPRPVRGLMPSCC